ncbi:Periplasmic binding protein domain protein [Neomoorella glycerini]|uniref:Periplasmic binding protein domain protein n=1 Tax=Neomoorella glycerini TaxID=55779 RepID=A0A6I5ZN04_9FIRM|nr:sugar ABC transporter substrate-binding protein [Moorella glycerini]QGP91270.1 Periplasmic binding protein domain protein [Moorella glycerini]
MKKLLILLGVLVLSFLFLSGCGQSNQSAGKSQLEGQKSQENASSTSTKKLKFAMIIHDTGNSFFSVMDRAAQDAAKQLGVEVKFMGPKTFDVAQEVNMLESAVDAGYDGIAFTAPDPKAFDRPIKKAKEKGIPTVAFNTDAPDCGRDAFVGQDLEQSGYILGKLIFEKYMKGEGKYIITTCAPGHTALEARIAGIKRAQKEFPNIQLVNIIDITSDLSKAYGVIENAYTANKDVKAFLGVDVYSEAIGTFIQTKNLNGKVLGGGFDLTPGTLKHIANGAMQVTIGQNPYLQGYFPIHMLYLKKTKDISPVNINTGVEIVTKENVQDYLNRKE